MAELDDIVRDNARAVDDSLCEDMDTETSWRRLDLALGDAMFLQARAQRAIALRAHKLKANMASSRSAPSANGLNMLHGGSGVGAGAGAGAGAASAIGTEHRSHRKTESFASDILFREADALASARVGFTLHRSNID